EPGDAAAARADRVDVNHRRTHRVAVDEALGAHQRDASSDERDIAARAADIDRDEIAEALGAPRLATADDTCCRPREKEPNRPLARDARREDAAARLHDLERRLDAAGIEVSLHAAEIAVKNRLHISVEGGDRGALVFAKARIDLGGKRDEELGMLRRGDLADAL